MPASEPGRPGAAQIPASDPLPDGAPADAPATRPPAAPPARDGHGERPEDAARTPDEYLEAPGSHRRSDGAATDVGA